jgi:serine protease Do
MTEISKLSSGFGAVVAHDGITRPEQMGGPVVDLEGRVVGMNIARYDRTATHAIPASRMTEIVKDLTERARKARQSETAPAAK